MRKLAATLLAGSMIACAPVKKPAPKPPEVEIPFFESAEKREAPRPWGERQCFESTVSPEMLDAINKIRETKEGVGLPIKQQFGKGDNILHWSGSAVLDPTMSLPIVVDYKADWTMGAIRENEIEIKIYEKSAPNFEETEKRFGIKFTKEEKLAGGLKAGNERELSYVAVLGETPVIKSDEGQIELDFLFHISVLEINSVCFRNTNRDTAFIEIE